MNINFHPVSNPTISMWKEKILDNLNDQQKKIIAIAAIAIGLVVACYTIYRCCCFKAKIKPVPNGDKDSLSPKTAAKILELPEKKPVVESKETPPEAPPTEEPPVTSPAAESPVEEPPATELVEEQFVEIKEVVVEEPRVELAPEVAKKEEPVEAPKEPPTKSPAQRKAEKKARIEEAKKKFKTVRLDPKNTPKKAPKVEEETVPARLITASNKKKFFEYLEENGMKIKNLNLTGSSFKISNIDLEKIIECCASIETLCLTGSKIDGEGIQHLNQLTKLQSLNLSLLDISDEGFALLALPSLQSLDLSSCLNITNKGLAHLINFPALQNLNLSYLKITDEDLEHLKDLPSLKSVSLYNCKEIKDVGISVLPKGIEVTLPKGKLITITE